MTPGAAARAPRRRRGSVTGAMLAAAMVLGLAGCGADRPKPTPLEAFEARLAAPAVWSTRVGRIDFPLAVTARGNQVVVASGDGAVLALQAEDGRELWRGRAGASIAAGVGSDGRYAAVATADNELQVLDRGQPAWKATLGSRTVTAPLVAGERVFVVGVDRVVHAFDAQDGRRLWRFSRTGEPLTLAHPAVLAAYKDTLLVGQGASLVALDPDAGSVRWEVALTPPRGTNEVERLNDLVGPLLRLGDTTCMRAFQAAVGCVDVARRTLRWSRVGGGVQPLGGDAELIFGADSSDRVSAWRIGNGDLAWTHDRLLYRGLSAPLALPRSVVFGDAEGQLHFLARDDGRTLLRVPTDGSAVVAPPVLAGGLVIAVTHDGGVFAFRPE